MNRVLGTRFIPAASELLLLASRLLRLGGRLLCSSFLGHVHWLLTKRNRGPFTVKRDAPSAPQPAASPTPGSFTEQLRRSLAAVVPDTLTTHVSIVLYRPATCESSASRRWIDVFEKSFGCNPIDTLPRPARNSNHPEHAIVSLTSTSPRRVHFRLPPASTGYPQRTCLMAGRGDSTLGPPTTPSTRQPPPLGFAARSRDPPIIPSTQGGTAASDSRACPDRVMRRCPVIAPELREADRSPALQSPTPHARLLSN
jgi:hypothetical protein